MKEGSVIIVIGMADASRLAQVPLRAAHFHYTIATLDDASCFLTDRHIVTTADAIKSAAGLPFDGSWQTTVARP